jgi:hypothetical protein
MKQSTHSRHTLSLAVAALAAGLALPAQAVKFELDNGITGSFDTTLSFGFQRRMSGQDKTIIGNDSGGNVPTIGTLGTLVNGAGNGASANPDFNYTNVDDGDLNYNQGDIVSAVVKGTHELFLKNGSGWAALGRFTWSSDLKATDTRRTPLDSEARKAVKQNVSLLDLWVSKELKIGDNTAKFKLGNQVINWGEDIFILGGVNSVNALDLRKIHIPGTQLKEIFVPAPMLSMSTGIVPGVSMEAYYQFRWNSFILDPAGTYWSTADFLGKGGRRGAFIPSSVLGLPVGSVGDFDPTRGRTLAALDLANGGPGVLPVTKQEPGNAGQMGLNLRVKPADGDTEFAAYYLRYHDKLPFVGFRYDAATANVISIGAVEQYGKDRQLFGLSMNTKAGEWAVGAEISYRPRDSVAIDPTVPLAGPYSYFGNPNFGTATSYTMDGYKDERKWQAHLTGFRFLPSEVTRAVGAAEGYVMAEAAVTRYPNLDLSGAVPYLLNNYELPTKISWGYVVELGMTFANIFQSGWTVTPIADWYHDVKGVSPNTIPFVQGRKAVALGLNFDLHNKYKVGVNYTNFFGGGNLNVMRDRDVLGANVQVIF